MSRTNIELDDDLVAEVMRRYEAPQGRMPSTLRFDTSAWIDNLRGVYTAATQDVRRRLTESADELVACELAAMALLTGAPNAGLTIRSLTDCLIATIALRHGATLVHKDADFDVSTGVIEIDAVSTHVTTETGRSWGAVPYALGIRRAGPRRKGVSRTC